MNHNHIRSLPVRTFYTCGRTVSDYVQFHRKDSESLSCKRYQFNRQSTVNIHLYNLERKKMPNSHLGVNNNDNNRGKRSSSLLIIIGLLAVLMFTALYSINSSFHWQEMDSKAQLSSKVSKKSHDEFKRLMDQTKQLLNDMNAANTTLSPETLRDIKALTLEEKRIGEQNEVLETTIEQLENKVATCLKGKYDAETELDTCKHTLIDAQLQLQKLSSSSSSSSSSTTPTIKCPEAPVNTESLASHLFPTSVSKPVEEKKKWLVIGIPTVARRDDLDYLLKSLAAMVSQLPLDEDDPLYHNILIHIINMQVNNDRSHRHVVFDRAKALYGPGSGSVYQGYFKFSEMSPSEIEPDPLQGRTAQNDIGTPNVPGYLVRRQTRNIAYVMQRSVQLGKYYLFLEDDMMLCPHGIQAIQYVLRKASKYHPHWLAIRTSYGMNGIFLHDEDMTVFANYLLKHQRRRPPDHLVVEWYAGETPEAAAHKQKRVNIGFKFNLFDHLGVVSTLRAQQQTTFPRCYELLIEPTVFKVEAYNSEDCPRDDIWPCRNTKYPPEPVLINWARVVAP